MLTIADAAARSNALVTGEVHAIDARHGRMIRKFNRYSGVDRTSDLDGYGIGLCHLGDIDGDGTADFAVGRSDLSTPGSPRAVSGATG